MPIRLHDGWDGNDGQSHASKALQWLDERQILYRIDATETIHGFQNGWVRMSFHIVVEDMTTAAALRMVVPELIPAGYTD